MHNKRPLLYDGEGFLADKKDFSEALDVALVKVKSLTAVGDVTKVYVEHTQMDVEHVQMHADHVHVIPALHVLGSGSQPRQDFLCLVMLFPDTSRRGQETCSVVKQTIVCKDSRQTCQIGMVFTRRPCASTLTSWYLA